MAKKAAPKANAQANDVPALNDGEIYVDLLTDDGVVAERVVVSDHAKGFKIVHLGKWWEHVSEHADGTWQYKAL